MDRYPEITFAVENRFKQLITDKVTPWGFLNTGKMEPILDFYGKKIQYGGVIGFEGSPREVFWGGFIEPFLEDSFVWAFEFALCHAEKRNLDREQLVLYARECLLNGLYRTYGRMQKIDRVLRGKGFPDRIPLRDISREINRMQMKLDEYRDSALTALKVRNQQTACDTFSDVVEFKPGGFGFSFDLKKFWKWCISRNNHPK